MPTKPNQGFSVLTGTARINCRTGIRLVGRTMAGLQNNDAAAPATMLLRDSLSPSGVITGCLCKDVRAVCSSAKLKEIRVQTKLPEDVEQPKVARFFEAFDKDLYEQAGCRVQVSYSNHLHDRFVILDSGIVFKLGRGLDIYKPASGLASSNASVRKVREWYAYDEDRLIDACARARRAL
jgi:hypothetical protein